MFSVVVISKNEPALEATLSALEVQAHSSPEEVEIIVIDASGGKLGAIAERHPRVLWHDFAVPPGVRISIPHQRNAGIAAARGDVIIFTDAGCIPHDRWLETLIAPIRAEGEHVVAGLAVAPAGRPSHYGIEVERITSSRYLSEAPTINLAFRRDVVDAVGGFDEQFEYGSDLDFTWRIVDAGYAIRSVPGAVVEHEWGDPRRQLKRAYRYGKAKARLYAKHRSRRSGAVLSDPLVWVYPLFILGLPATLVLPGYPLLLLVPAWRARSSSPVAVVLDHLAYGAGVLAFLSRGIADASARS